jgi:PAS domain S-box-containing protein
MPLGARVYASAVIACGVVVLAEGFPRTVPSLLLGLSLTALSVLSSTLKVSLPLPTGSATMSVSYVADLMSLMLLGPNVAMITAGIGAWAQCVFSQRSRTGVFRTLFSIATVVLAVRTAGAAFTWSGGVPGELTWAMAGRPLVTAVMGYYLVNTGLVSAAIALATRESWLRVWRGTFLWSAPSYLVGAGLSALGAWLVQNGDIWYAPLVVAPGYLTYRTHKVYLGRLADERRHVEEISALHQQAVKALDLAKESQQALAAEKGRLTVTLRSLREAVITTGMDGRIVLVNHAAEIFAGCTQAQAVGRLLADVIRLSDPRTGQACENPVEVMLRQQGDVDSGGRVALVAADGTERLVEHTATPLRNNQGGIEGMVLVLRDVSDALRLEQERQKADRLESLGVLAGGIAHDFNNILTAIVGNVSIARADPAVDAVAAEYLAEAERACVRAKTLTHQLLTFSKGGAPVKRAASLNELVREAVGFALRGTNVRCDFELSEELWAVEVDEGQMVQVLHNLVINGQQAMPGGGTIVVRSENVPATAEAAGNGAAAQVRISVEDRGVGIPEANLRKIFDPYFTTKQTGSGLGLATTYSIVKNHGGRIDVQSTVDQGTTVTVLLPARPGLPPARRASVTAPRTGKGRILVMDDEESLRKLVCAMLQRLGYEVEVAADGRQAIEMYRRAMEQNRDFDAVVMDLTVPGGIGGKDAIRDLLRIDPGVRAIVSSGYADDPVLADYERHGFKAIVPKPFGSAELGAALDQVLH